MSKSEYKNELTKFKITCLRCASDDVYVRHDYWATDSSGVMIDDIKFTCRTCGLTDILEEQE